MTISKQNFDVRDLRQKDQFITDDQFLNGYARFVGIYAVGVYGSLCRHANKEQNSWPSIRKICEELSISRNSVIEAVKKLEFWNIVKKKRIGKTANNRYWLIHKKNWKRVSEVHLKDFSEVCGGDFSSLCGKLHQFATRTSNSKELNSKETHRKESTSKKKPYYDDLEVREAQGKTWVIPKDGGQWLEFAGEKEDIIYK